SYNPQTARPVSTDSWQAESHCGMARWAWSVRQAELRKVRSARGFRAAQRSDRLAPKASMGNGRLSAVGREGTAGTRLLRLDKPASGRRHHATVAAVRDQLPDLSRTQSGLPRIMAVAHLRCREPTKVLTTSRCQRREVLRGARSPRPTRASHGEGQFRHSAGRSLE